MTTSDRMTAEPLDDLPAFAASPNRLLRAAYPLLECIPHIRLSRQALDLAPLHDRLATQIKAFSLHAKQAGLDDDTVAMGRYCLCALLDEIVSDTSWGSDNWAARSLLVTFHQETSGGERFFGILQWLSRQPGEHLEQLEFMYVLLSLGMEGRYRLIDGGHDELVRLRERLYQILRNGREATESALAPDWKQTVLPTAKVRGQPLIQGIAIGMPILLLAVFLGLDNRLALLARQSLPIPTPVALRSTDDQTGKAASAPELAQLLADEIHRRQLMLEVQPDRTILTLRVDSLFASGSAVPLPSNLPLLQNVARALATVPGRIEVTGHSDNRPTAPGAPDNRQLSLERAEAVAKLLIAGQVDSRRITAAGRGPDDPLLPNTTPANRARNRRVVISLFNVDAGA
jgi:type VI secretion system protein ImpK